MATGKPNGGQEKDVGYAVSLGDVSNSKILRYKRNSPRVYDVCNTDGLNGDAP